MPPRCCCFQIISRIPCVGRAPLPRLRTLPGVTVAGAATLPPRLCCLQAFFGHAPLPRVRTLPGFTVTGAAQLLRR
eukprot:2945156-Alexandrium_andersonii.AAC.1